MRIVSFFGPRNQNSFMVRGVFPMNLKNVSEDLKSVEQWVKTGATVTLGYLAELCSEHKLHDDLERSFKTIALQHDTLTSLIYMAMNGTKTESTIAAFALMNFSLAGDEMKQAMVDLGAVNAFDKMITNGCRYQVRFCLAGLKSLASQSESRQRDFEEQGIISRMEQALLEPIPADSDTSGNAADPPGILAAAIISGTEIEKEQALSSLLQKLNDIEKTESLIEINVMKHLFDLARTGSPNLVEKSESVLNALATGDDKIKLLLVHEGLVKPLADWRFIGFFLTMLLDGACTKTEVVIEALELMSQNKVPEDISLDLNQSLIANNLIGLLCCSEERNLDLIGIHRITKVILGVLFRVCHWEGGGGQLVIEEEKFKYLVILFQLEHATEDQKILLIDIFRILAAASDHNRNMLLCTGAIGHLTAFVGDQSIKTNSCNLDCNEVQKLISIVEAFSWLSLGNNEVKHAIAAEKGIAVLVRGLNLMDPTKTHAITALQNIATGNYETKQYLLREECVEPLALQFQGESVPDDSISHAATVLALICTEVEKKRMKLKKRSVIMLARVFVMVLNSDTSCKLKDCAIHALSILAAKHDIQKALLDFGALLPIVELSLFGSEMERIKSENLINFLLDATLRLPDEHSTILLKGCNDEAYWLKIIEFIAKHLSSEPPASEYAVVLIEQLSSRVDLFKIKIREYKSQSLKHGIIPLLVNMAVSGTGLQTLRLARVASRALDYLVIENEDNAVLLPEGTVMDHILGILCTPDLSKAILEQRSNIFVVLNICCCRMKDKKAIISAMMKAEVMALLVGTALQSTISNSLLQKQAKTLILNVGVRYDEHWSEISVPEAFAKFTVELLRSGSQADYDQRMKAVQTVQKLAAAGYGTMLAEAGIVGIVSNMLAYLTHDKISDADAELNVMLTAVLRFLSSCGDPVQTQITEHPIIIQHLLQTAGQSLSPSSYNAMHSLNSMIKSCSPIQNLMLRDDVLLQMIDMYRSNGKQPESVLALQVDMLRNIASCDAKARKALVEHEVIEPLVKLAIEGSDLQQQQVMPSLEYASLKQIHHPVIIRAIPEITKAITCKSKNYSNAARATLRNLARGDLSTKTKLVQTSSYEPLVPMIHAQDEAEVIHVATVFALAAQHKEDRGKLMSLGVIPRLVEIAAGNYSDVLVELVLIVIKHIAEESSKSRKLLLKEGKGLIVTLVKLNRGCNITIQADAATTLCLLGKGDTFTKNQVYASDDAVRVIMRTAQLGCPEVSTTALESLLELAACKNKMKLIRSGILDISLEILSSQTKSVNAKNLVSLILKALSEGDSEARASLLDSKILDTLGNLCSSH